MNKTQTVLTMLFLLTNKVKSTFEGDPDISHMNNLVCYQCESESSDAHSTCESHYIKIVAVQERGKIIIQCPYYKNNFCVKVTVTNSSYSKISRGCSSFQDEAGQELRKGCMSFLQYGMQQVVCLCSSHLCNDCTGTDYSKNLIAVIVLSLLMY